ncbi:MAG: bifunctional folylpolyglutamate synthase/dihydrofolate synthase, partial [Clostridiales bacterium]|nr:bifunctional folylpolyglutamate synthase/dihydrofolate synthase [Clostridiales bacterium]
MTYDEARAYLDSTLRFGSKPGLTRIGALLSYMGNPQNKLKYVHIAGTNGKGSTSTMIANVLK